MKLYNICLDFRKVGELTKKYSNLPDSYIKRSMEQIVYRTPNHPAYQKRSVGRKKIDFTVNRPWTLRSRMENFLHDKPKKVFIEPINEWTIFKGDRVEVLDGPDKGKQGIVMMVIQERNWVLVEGLNIKLVVARAEKDSPATIVKEEQPLRVTDQISLIDPSDFLPCAAEWRFKEDGGKVRVSQRSGRLIPMPVLSEETYDYKTPRTYQEREKDTTADIVKKITFTPTLATFEMDIMKKMNIHEDRVPAQSFFY